MVTISTDRFTFDREENIFVAEASDLSVPGDDPLPSGLNPFYLQSQWTGRSAQVVPTDTIRDREQEIIAWVFHPTDPDISDAFTVHILND
jgi:hypothetical protein